MTQSLVNAVEAVAKLSDAISDSATSIAVTNIKDGLGETPFSVLVDRELMLVTATEADHASPWTVERNCESMIGGSGAVAHASGKEVKAEITAGSLASVLTSAQAAAEAASIPLGEKGAESGVAELGSTGHLPLAQLSLEAQANEVIIDICRRYGAAPGEDITAKLREALAELVALGGGTIFFSNAGHYLLHGALVEGEAFGYKYAGQILLPARTTGEGGITVKIRGCSAPPKPMLGDGIEVRANVPGVVLESNLTSGSVFDAIPAFEEPTAKHAFTDVLGAFEDISVLVPENPTCNAIKGEVLTRLQTRNVTVGAPGTDVPIGNPEGATGTGIVWPQTENAGSIRADSTYVYGFAVGWAISEHLTATQCFLGRCNAAIEGLGAAHANYLGYLSVEECPVILRGPDEGHKGAVLFGVIDYENVSGAVSGNVIEDPQNAFYGSVTIFDQTSKTSGFPVTGGQNLDVVLPYANGGIGWKGCYPVDTFERSAWIEGNIGNCSLTGHPWRGIYGVPTISGGKLKNGHAGQSSALLRFYRRVGSGSRIIKLGIETGSGAYNVGAIVGHLYEGTSKGHDMICRLSGGKVILELVGTTDVTLASSSAGVVAEGKAYELSIAVTHPSYYGAPTEVRVWVGATEVISYTLSGENRAQLEPEASGEAIPFHEDGVFFGNDELSAITRFEVIPAGSERGPPGEKGEKGEGGSAAGALPILMPIHASGAPIAHNDSAIGVAYKACFQRCIVPTTGTLASLYVWNGGTAAGEMLVAVFDTGETKKGEYTRLWEGVAVAMTGTSLWQLVGKPELAVTAGAALMVAGASSSTTATFGIGQAPLNSAASELPENFMPVAGDALPKLVAYRELGELKYAAAITEANMIKGGTGLLIIGAITPST